MVVIFTHAAGLQGLIASANSSCGNRAQAFGHPEVNYGWYLHILNTGRDTLTPAGADAPR